MINGIVDLDSPAAFRPYGSLFHLSSTGSFGPNMFWLDLGENSLLSFVDGARFETETHLEVRVEIHMDFQLSEISFQTLNVGGLWDANGANWSDFIFNIDVSKFSAESGTSLVLMDFSSHTQVFSGEFTPEINIINDQEELDVELYFDTEKSQLILLILSE